MQGSTETGSPAAALVLQGKGLPHQDMLTTGLYDQRSLYSL